MIHKLFLVPEYKISITIEWIACTYIIPGSKENEWEMTKYHSIKISISLYLNIYILLFKNSNVYDMDFNKIFP